MKIVIDTNVFISGIFFGGIPHRILDAAVTGKVTACANSDIINEYNRIIDEMTKRKQGHLSLPSLLAFISKIDIYDSISKINISRDPNDNKFIECAVDSHALYIVSGDNDLLVLKEYEDIEIITAAEFYRRYLSETTE